MYAAGGGASDFLFLRYNKRLSVLESGAIKGRLEIESILQVGDFIILDLR